MNIKIEQRILSLMALHNLKTLVVKLMKQQIVKNIIGLHNGTTVNMLNLEYFRSFVHLEDFIPKGFSLKKKQKVIYLQLDTYFYICTF